MREGLVVRRTWGLTIAQWTAVGAVAALAAAAFAGLQLVGASDFARAAGTVPPEVTEPTVLEAPSESLEGEPTETRVANPDAGVLECEYQLTDEDGEVIFQDDFTVQPGEVVLLEVSVEAEGRYTRVVFCRSAIPDDDVVAAVQEFSNHELLRAARTPSACRGLLGSDLPDSRNEAIQRICAELSDELRSVPRPSSDLPAALSLRSFVDELPTNPPPLVLLEDTLTVTSP